MQIRKNMTLPKLAAPSPLCYTDMEYCSERSFSSPETERSTMELQEFLDRMNAGETVIGGSDAHLVMHALSQRALQITMELNSTYHTPEEVTALMERLTGQKLEQFGPAVLYRLRKEHPHRKRRVHQFRLPLSGSGRHLHRRREPHRP